MKKSIILFLFLPLMTLAQVSDWRKPSTSSSSSSSGSSSTSTPNRTTDQSPTISSWRNEPQRQTTPVYTPPKRPVYQPFYYGPSYNRWNNWGAPYMGFDYWTPGFITIIGVTENLQEYTIIMTEDKIPFVVENSFFIWSSNTCFQK